jgi:N-acetylneuraminic acid mutarotase
MSDSDRHAGDWAERAPLPMRNHDMGCFPHDGELIAVSGFNRDENFDDVVAYDPAADAWRRDREPIPTARGLYGGTMVDGEAYVAGGQRLHEDFVAGRTGLKYDAFDELERYDPAADRWTSLAPMSVRRAGPGAAARDGRVVVAGGMCFDDPESFPDDDAITDLVEVYDPATDEWSRGPRLPGPRMCPTVETVDGTLYVAGGYRDGEFVDDVYALEAGAQEWSPRAPLEVPRRDGPSLVHDGRLYVFGGITTPAGDGEGEGRFDFTAACERYDPATDRWTRLPSLPTAKAWSGAGAVDDTALVVGGANRPGDEYVFLDEVHALPLS